jgi:hypothetical protein
VEQRCTPRAAAIDRGSTRARRPCALATPAPRPCGCAGRVSDAGTSRGLVEPPFGCPSAHGSASIEQRHEGQPVAYLRGSTIQAFARRQTPGDCFIRDAGADARRRRRGEGGAPVPTSPGRAPAALSASDVGARLGFAAPAAVRSRGLPVASWNALASCWRHLRSQSHRYKLGPEGAAEQVSLIEVAPCGEARRAGSAPADARSAHAWRA